MGTHFYSGSCFILQSFLEQVSRAENENIANPDGIIVSL